MNIILGEARDRAERIALMTARYLAGDTLQTIGAAFGVSRERVRQLLRKAGVDAIHRPCKTWQPLDVAGARWRAAGRRKGYITSYLAEPRRRAKRRELRDQLVALARVLGRTPTSADIAAILGYGATELAGRVARYWSGRPGRTRQPDYANAMRRWYRAAGLRRWPPGQSPLHHPDPTPASWWEAP